MVSILLCKPPSIVGLSTTTRKMVPITGRARSFLLKQNREEGETE